MKKLLLFLLFSVANPTWLNAQGMTLVDFNESAASSTFQLPGWDTILKSDNVNFTSAGNGGVIVSSECQEYEEYRGISGTSRIFSIGERIAVTWYNNSDEIIFFTARVSFTDSDEPDAGDQQHKWYTMRSFEDYRRTYSEILPHETVKTVFNITDSGIHKTDESFSLVNINLAIEWGETYQKQFLICEKIELLDDADITPPLQPENLTAFPLSDSKIQLFWNEPPDSIGIVEYLIYMDGEIEGYSRSNTFNAVFLEPDKHYTFSIIALDAAGNKSPQSAFAQATTHSYSGSLNLVNPAGLEYLGAIAVPETFSWGGEAIAHDSGTGSGSLFITNLNQPENSLVGRISLPAPIISSQKDTADLNQAAVLEQPLDIRPANVNNWEYVDIWRTGLHYLPDENRLYSAWSIHYTVNKEKHASISCCNAADLTGTKYGAWYIGSANQPPLDAATSDWLFSMPQTWADANSNGRSLVVGRCRDGGLSGLGPTLYAFSPVGATPPAADAELDMTTLLEYGSVLGTDNYHFPNSIDGYKHSDDWREALWLTADTQNAVAIVGNKALGHNWYGYHGEHMHHDWVIADVPYPEFYETDPDGKGWRAHNQQPMIIFYNPDDLANVANGSIQPYEPQPYAALRIPENQFFGSSHEIFSAAFDDQNNILYVTEFVRELEGHLILHAWQVRAVSTDVEAIQTRAYFYLEQNYPNPLNSYTTIRYSLSQPTHVNISIFNTLGQHVKTLIDKNHPAGLYSTNWDATDESGESISSGLYFCKMQAGDFTEIVRILYIK